MEGGCGWLLAILGLALIPSADGFGLMLWQESRPMHRPEADARGECGIQPRCIGAKSIDRVIARLKARGVLREPLRPALVQMDSKQVSLGRGKVLSTLGPWTASPVNGW